MNIILFTNKRGQVLNVELNPVRLGLLAMLGLVLMFAASVYTGVRMADDELDYVARMQDSVDAQRSDIEAARLQAQADLDALTLRIGRMQAQLLRLNALGGRLVEQADIDSQEFDFSSEPALGGPHPEEGGDSVAYPEFLSMLDSLDAELKDRERKLGVLEDLLMTRSLNERVMPSGRPVAEGWLSSRYGKRNDPFTGKQEHHKGQDFAGKAGSHVIAVGDGVITWAGERSGYGNLVEVNHGNGYVTRYGHNHSHLVKEGDTVKKGQKIALMGSTGRSTGPHVHFEVLHNGKQVNPARYTGK